MSFKQSKWVAFRFSFNLAVIILIKIIFPSTDIALMMASSALMTACIAAEKTTLNQKPHDNQPHPRRPRGEM